MKILLTSILFIMALCVTGQHVPYGLREKNVQEELVSRTKGFDSLILFDKAGYWNEDMQMSGLGFKGDQIHKVSISFKSGARSFYDMKVKDITKTRITNGLTFEVMQKMKIFSVITLNSDSLNRKPTWDISDQDEWTILWIRQKEISIKQSYAPEVYQPILPTNDRRLFMNLFDQLNSVIN